MFLLESNQFVSKSNQLTIDIFDTIQFDFDKS